MKTLPVPARAYVTAVIVVGAGLLFIGLPHADFARPFLFLALLALATASAALKVTLPLTTSGDPALWNAFPGRWGEQKCILGGAYCDLSGAPKGPSFQTRYKEPDGEVDEYCLSGRRLVRC